MPASVPWRRLGAVALAWFASCAAADEGFWTYDQVPVEAIARQYGVRLSPQWLQRLAAATVRADVRGTSGAFVSADGLVITARHVIPPRSRPALHKELAQGYLARSLAAERRVPGMYLDAVVASEDVTAQVVAGHKDEGSAARRDRIAAIERGATLAPHGVAQVVALFGGARYVLYRYHRYDDVRLVFAPEDAMAGFAGGYPAPNFDVALLRVYEDGRPAHVGTFLRIARRVPAEGEPVFISGAPSAWSRRHLAAADLRMRRDGQLPVQVETMARLAARTAAWVDSHPQAGAAERRAAEGLDFEASYFRDAARDLRDPATLAHRQALDAGLENSLRAANDAGRLELLREVEASAVETGAAFAAGTLAPWCGAQDAPPWMGEDAASPWAAATVPSAWALAVLMLRTREEAGRAAADRAPAYGETERARREAWLLGADGPAPIDPDLEVVWLAAFFDDLSALGDTEPRGARAFLDGQASAQRAAVLLRDTRIRDAAWRRNFLVASDTEAATLHDALLDAVRAGYASCRAAAQRYEAARERLDRAEDAWFAATATARGSAEYPDASNSLRFGYGSVAGLVHEEFSYGDGSWHRDPPTTSLGDLYTWSRRPTAPVPFELDPAWQCAEGKLPRRAVVNFLSNVDGFAGSSGSVTVDAQGEVVGVLFGGTGGGALFELFYSGDLRHGERSVHVGVPALRVALREVYGARALLDELDAGHR